MMAKICDNKNNGCTVTAEIDGASGVIKNKKDLFWYRICFDVEVEVIASEENFNNLFISGDAAVLDRIVYDLCSIDCLVEKSHDMLDAEIRER